MPRPPRVQPAPIKDTSVEDQIVTLVRDYQSSWQDFFCEAELHAHFYHQCRAAFPRYRNKDGIETTSIHHRYETFWRYVDGDRFAKRHQSLGDYATFDFVFLRDVFIQTSSLRGLTNRYEPAKALARNYPGTDMQTRDIAIVCAIEIKLASPGEDGEVDRYDINRLEDRMLDAVRKIAAERIQRAFIVGLSQGPPPDLSRAQAIVAMCMQLHSARYPEGNLSVAVATPQQTVLGGEWSEEADFPRVVAQRGWPVLQADQQRASHQHSTKET